MTVSNKWLHPPDITPTWKKECWRAVGLYEGEQKWSSSRSGVLSRAAAVRCWRRFRPEGRSGSFAGTWFRPQHTSNRLSRDWRYMVCRALSCKWLSPFSEEKKHNNFFLKGLITLALSWLAVGTHAYPPSCHSVFRMPPCESNSCLSTRLYLFAVFCGIHP